MSVVSPPEVPPSASIEKPLAPTPPRAYANPPREPDSARRHRPGGGVGAGLILIALGIVALFGTWFPAGGAFLFLGLGAAFLVARALTGRSGYAVPAGILLGFGAFVWLSDAGMLSRAGSGSIFFVCLGLGFLAVYAIAARPQAVWPVIPAIVLIGFGALIQATTFGVPYAQFWSLAQFWPLSLVAIGAWLLLRDRVPVAARTPVAMLGAGVLILVGLLVAAAGIASVGTPYARWPMQMPMPMPWPMFQVPFGNPPIQDSITVSAPANSLHSIRLVNTSGSTVVRSTSASEVTVQATRHYWTADQAPDVRLTPSNGVLIVESTPVTFGGAATYVDYLIDAPAALGADLRSASGSIAVSGFNGPVRIESASGGIDARDLQGSVVIGTASGGVRMASIDGEVQVSSASGGIVGSAVDRVRDVHSMSGGIDLGGAFATDGQIGSTSGSVVLRFTPRASAHIDANSLSGGVTASGLGLNGEVAGPHSLSGNLAAGGPTVAVRTTSGSIQLTRGS